MYHDIDIVHRYPLAITDVGMQGLFARLDTSRVEYRVLYGLYLHGGVPFGDDHVVTDRVIDIRHVNDHDVFTFFFFDALYDAIDERFRVSRCCFQVASAII